MTFLLGLFAFGASAQTCPPPDTILVNIDTVALELTVDLVGADSVWLKCEVQVRESLDTTGSWRRARIDGTSILVNLTSNLAPQTDYDLRSRCACALPPDTLDVSPFSPLTSFTSPEVGSRMGVEATTFNVYPNPVVNTMSIDYIADFDAEIEVSVIDMAGRVVVQQQHNVLSGANAINLDLSSLENGNYFVSVSNGTAEKVQPFSVAR